MYPAEPSKAENDALAGRLTDPQCCAVILSGGLNSRMAGRNKAFLEVGGKSILDRLLIRLRPLFEEILLVTRQPHLYTDFPVRIVEDIYRDRSSLTGIHAALVNARAEYGFVVPCDTPFLNPAVIRLLLDAAEPRWGAVVPLLGEHYEPLCAIYSKSCLPVIEAMLDRGDYKIVHLFDQIRVTFISADRIKRVDPELLSFFNVNTPAAYRGCQQLIGKRSVS
ncbi:MAG: molybdenum cofactor guanylyltransferase [Desulfosarcinaceae bacterium]|jgi:molybdopterin-guanine dinucleotide biosynthesis protein A